MGLVRNVQIAWGVYKTVKGFLGKGGGKEDAVEKIGGLLEAGAGAKASAKAAEQGLSKATDLIPLDKGAGAVAGALAMPLLRRVKRTAIKGGVLIGTVAIASKVVPWYLKRKFGDAKEA